MKFFQIAKRITLFLLVNILVMMTLSVLVSVLGLDQMLNQQGISYGGLAAFCLVWGMGGALISLALSRMMAKWMMGVQVIDPHTSNSELQELVQMVHRLARSAHLPKMPEVGIYDSPEVNAFATGPTQSRALVAVSSGLLQRMRNEEVEGVLGHEVAHIANGDMVTMTLLQGVVNAFVMFLARVLAFAVAQSMRNRDDDRRGGGHFMEFMLVQLFQFVFMILGSIVVASFSRWREYRADAGGARLAGRDKMIGALQALQRVVERNDEIAQQEGQAPAFQSMKISGKGHGILAWFSTHPPLEERIKRLETATG